MMKTLTYRRAGSLARPISPSVFGGAALERQNVFSPNDLKRQAPLLMSAALQHLSLEIAR